MVIMDPKFLGSIFSRQNTLRISRFPGDWADEMIV